MVKTNEETGLPTWADEYREAIGQAMGDLTDGQVLWVARRAGAPRIAAVSFERLDSKVREELVRLGHWPPKGRTRIVIAVDRIAEPPNIGFHPFTPKGVAPA